ncbi:hypothetical protein N0V93_002547 [Gnomoniopsis smithogilvyi]|uniref:Uncharacterized protein n=1 Tax=Gnomoniopsis smithogilvyi TaxID=1191159 RepID=A0A9W8YWN7_9PEZI|nr:hypothetical protein N0V93_002547 [Gnomoniopsis smithogilvyi]
MPLFSEAFPPGAEYPPKADLRRDVYRPLPKITPGTVDPAEMVGNVPIARAREVLAALNVALISNDTEKLTDCFFQDQAFWRDIVALSSHLRAFFQPKAIANVLLPTNSLRRIEGPLEITGEPHFVVMSPVMAMRRSCIAPPPRRFTKDEVAEHLEQCAANFHLNIIPSTTLQSTAYDSKDKKWTFRLGTANRTGSRTVTSKHLHSRKLPSTSDVIHIQSVAVIGSANIAFDVIKDCHEAGFKTTMVARSPTYAFPYKYVMDPHSIGAYDLMPLEVADRMLNTFPLALDMENYWASWAG